MSWRLLGVTCKSIYLRATRHRRRAQSSTATFARCSTHHPAERGMPGYITSETRVTPSPQDVGNSFVGGGIAWRTDLCAAFCMRGQMAPNSFSVRRHTRLGFQPRSGNKYPRQDGYATFHKRHYRGETIGGTQMPKGSNLLFWCSDGFSSSVFQYSPNPKPVKVRFSDWVTVAGAAERGNVDDDALPTNISNCWWEKDATPS